MKKLGKIDFRYDDQGNLHITTPQNDHFSLTVDSAIEAELGCRNPIITITFDNGQILTADHMNCCILEE